MIQYRRISFQNAGWHTRVGLFVGIALAVAVAIAFVVLSLGLVLILLPVVAVALLVGRWRLSKLMATARADADRRRNDGRTIETDYRVIDGRERR